MNMEDLQRAFISTQKTLILNWNKAFFTAGLNSKNRFRVQYYPNPNLSRLRAELI